MPGREEGREATWGGPPAPLGEAAGMDDGVAGVAEFSRGVCRRMAAAAIAPAAIDEALPTCDAVLPPWAIVGGGGASVKTSAGSGSPSPQAESTMTARRAVGPPVDGREPGCMFARQPGGSRQRRPHCRPPSSSCCRSSSGLAAGEPEMVDSRRRAAAAEPMEAEDPGRGGGSGSWRAANRRRRGEAGSPACARPSSPATRMASSELPRPLGSSSRSCA